MFHLVVTTKFGAYTPGQTITDQDKVAAILADSKLRRNVVKIGAPA